MKFPLISVVTPSYNQGKFIEDTIESVLDQGYPNLEYIIIDGGSNDETIDIIRRYEKHLAFWASETDRGASDAIARGFSRSTGAILAYLNSDDLYLPGTLHAIAEAMTEPDVDVAFGNTYWIDSSGNILGERRQTPFVRMGYLYGGSDLQQPATFWKRNLYVECGGMDQSYLFAFDTDLFTRFAVRGARFKHVNKFLASFRIHPESKSSNHLDICEQELRRLRQEHLPFPFQSIRASCVRNVARVQRTLWYAVQGDLLWLLGRIPDRIRARNALEIAGPRARRM
jgi:glycosyltransferase involved in cell wall biosynthesis